MARELMLLVATAIVCVAPGIHGRHHLSFAVGVKVSEITRTGCGETKLCIETPADCDPKDPGCLFTSIVHNTSTSPTTLTVALCGESTGYIAMGLTRDLKDTEPFVVFLCAQNNAQNGAFFFRTQMKDSEGNLTPEGLLETNVKEIRGTVDGDMITCEFNIPDIEDKMHVILGSGTAEAVTLGVFNTALESGLKTVTDPTSA